jgi:hypothetical protein
MQYYFDVKGKHQGKHQKLRGLQLVAIKQPANVRRIPFAGIPCSGIILQSKYLKKRLRRRRK